MAQYPRTYVNPSSESAQFEDCSQGNCIQKLSALENEIQELKMLLQQMAEKAKYYYGI
jgi:hypothetical protein